MKDTASSAFRSKGKYPNAAANPPENCERTSDQTSALLLLNEHVADSQRPADDSRLLWHVKDPFRARASSNRSTRTRDIAANNSVAIARTEGAEIGDPETKLGTSSNNRDDFFGGLHPSRLTMISVPKAPTMNEANAQSGIQISETVQKSKRSQVVRPSTQQTIVKSNKRPLSQVESDRNANSVSRGNPKTKIPKLSASCAGPLQPNLERSLKNLENVGIGFAVEGIESLVDRYRHLNPAVPPGQEWMFALQEVTAILRTPTTYNYRDWWNQGISVDLHTNFKIFKFRGPFKNRNSAKDLVTKKAVLHVIDGPYCFTKAAPVLEGKSLISLHLLKVGRF